VLVKHLTIRKATFIFGPERIVRGCVKNRLTLQRDNAAARGASKEICISDFGARPPSTVDRPGVITCLLKFLLDRLNRCRVKLSRVNGSWNHRPYCEKSYLLARKCSDSAPERSSLICKATRCILEILSTRDTRLVFEPECRLRPETLYGAMDTAALAPRHRAPWARKARHSIETLKILIPRPPKSFFEVPGSLRHLVRAGAPVLFCRLRPASAVEFRMIWRRSAPSLPTVEAFRQVVQSQLEAIHALMEAKPSEEMQRQWRGA
jgi:hypothetical protein